MEENINNLNIDDIDQINTDLDGKVGNNEIITRINLSPEQAEIQSNKISLQGKTINLTSDIINIASTNFSVDTNGNMNCNQATMSNVTVTSGNITIPDGLNKGVEVHADSNNHHYFTRQRAAAFNCYRDDTLMARMMDGASDIGGVLQLYNASGTMTIQCDGTNGNVRCVSLTQTSLADEKKNFVLLDNALQIVKDTDIYKYNFKFEDDKSKKHIGFVIGDDFNYRKELTSLDNDGVDVYSMASVLWQAVKEQQKEIEELKERIGK